MNKKTVLERFQAIKELEVADDLGTVADVLPYFCKNVEEALQRLEAIDNANPSKALECLENLKKQAVAFEHSELAIKVANGNAEVIKQNLQKLDFLEDAMDLPTNCFSTFKNRNGDEVTVMRREMYEKYQKQEKVLNIIKKKNVSSRWLIYCDTVELYNKTSLLDDKLNEEEFTLLKEVLK